MKAYHTQVIYDTGRWEYSFNGHAMVYVSAITERLNKKDSYLFSQSVHIYFHIALYVFIYACLFKTENRISFYNTCGELFSYKVKGALVSAIKLKPDF